MNRFGPKIVQKFHIPLQGFRAILQPVVDLQHSIVSSLPCALHVSWSATKLQIVDSIPSLVYEEVLHTPPACRGLHAVKMRGSPISSIVTPRLRIAFPAQWTTVFLINFAAQQL